ncbi:MAG: response regulator transcription factor [Acidobacteriota bacterium]|nr:response regulator transcription factor [Acidobacteriota bacterium]MDE3170097.1 response regulator transcription factor [Acidobacteriota bacterium]
MRLLLVEDEKKVASFVARSLREHQYAVEVAETGERALEFACNNTYDLILLDVRLPGINGVDVCREIRRVGLETPVLMLTARSLVEHRVEGLDAGADDYLTKPFALAELHARVRALTRRGFRGGAKLHVADLELDRPKRTVRRSGDPIPLTSKEFALLELLMLRSPEATNRSEIIEHVWTHGFDIETNIVEVYINRLRRKVDQAYPVKLIHTVRGTGYQLAEPGAAS